MTAEFTLTVAIVLVALGHLIGRHRDAPRWATVVGDLLFISGIAYALTALWALSGGPA